LAGFRIVNDARPCSASVSQCLASLQLKKDKDYH
jgi:hypothetical protein